MSDRRTPGSLRSSPIVTSPVVLPEPSARPSTFATGTDLPEPGAAGAPSPPLTKGPNERPVFVDQSGRRARMIMLAARVGAAVAAAWLLAMGAGALGLGPLPGLTWPPAGGSVQHSVTRRAVNAAGSDLTDARWPREGRRSPAVDALPQVHSEHRRRPTSHRGQSGGRRGSSNRAANGSHRSRGSAPSPSGRSTTARPGATTGARFSRRGGFRSASRAPSPRRTGKGRVGNGTGGHSPLARGRSSEHASPTGRAHRAGAGSARGRAHRRA